MKRQTIPLLLALALALAQPVPAGAGAWMEECMGTVATGETAVCEEQFGYPYDARTVFPHAAFHDRAALGQMRIEFYARSGALWFGWVCPPAGTPPPDEVAHAVAACEKTTLRDARFPPPPYSPRLTLRVIVDARACVRPGLAACAFHGGLVFSDGGGLA